MEAWFAEQVNAPISTYPDQPMLTSDGKKNNDARPVQVAFFQNALNGPDQLRQRVAFALSEIWVVSETGGVKHAAAFPPLFNIFQNGAFGNYEQIMKEVTLNPAMGRFLNMVNNDKANPAKGTSANENYAREIVQLFTLGLTQLNMDGSPVRDDNGNPVPTYTQSTVTALAKALTGWTYPPKPGTVTRGHNAIYYIGPWFRCKQTMTRRKRSYFLASRSLREEGRNRTSTGRFMCYLCSLSCRPLCRNC